MWTEEDNRHQYNSFQLFWQTEKKRPKLIEAEYQEMHFNPKYRSPVLIRESPNLELKRVFSDWELETYRLKAKWLISTKITSEIDKLSAISQNFSDYILNIKVCWFCSPNLCQIYSSLIMRSPS